MLLLINQNRWKVFNFFQKSWFQSEELNVVPITYIPDLLAGYAKMPLSLIWFPMAVSLESFGMVKRKLWEKFLKQVAFLAC